MIIIIPKQVFAQEEQKSDVGIFTSFVLAVAGLSGVGGLFWGIYQFKEARNDRSKEVFFQLAKEFDSTEEIIPAKKILDC